MQQLQGSGLMPSVPGLGAAAAGQPPVAAGVSPNLCSKPLMPGILWTGLNPPTGLSIRNVPVGKVPRVVQQHGAGRHFEMKICWECSSSHVADHPGILCLLCGSAVVTQGVALLAISAAC